MKNILATLAVIALVITGFLSLNSQEPQAKDEKKLDGKTIFIAKKCNGCHSIDAVGVIKKTGSSTQKGAPDLSDEGSKRDSTFLTKWLQWKETVKGKKHLIKFVGKDEEFKTLVQWLASLKKEEKH